MSKETLIKNASHASYWLKHMNFSSSESRENQIQKILRLKNAAGNFARILTKKNIPIKFSTQPNSYTDGKQITITDIIEREFDVVCGLILHEASHCVLTDFKFKAEFLTNWHAGSWKNLGVPVNPKFAKSPCSSDQFNSVRNWIEDRRIDEWVCSTCPGYIGYYAALYRMYWNNPEVNKHYSRMFHDPSHLQKDYQTYVDVVLSLLNPTVQSLKFPGVQDILKLIDLPNISRLQSTADSHKLTMEVFNVIADHVDDTMFENPFKNPNEQKQQQQQQQGDGVSTEEGGDEKQEQDQPQLSAALRALMEEVEKSEATESQQIAFKPAEPSSDSVVKMEKIHDIRFIRELEEENAISDYTQKDTVNYGGKNHKVENVLVYSQAGFKAAEVQFADSREVFRNNGEIAGGKRLGDILKTQDEHRKKVSTRHKHGRIDGRLLNELAFQNGKIFQQVAESKPQSLYIHLSLDISSSMAGQKMKDTKYLTSMLMVAFKQISNVEFEVSVRSDGGAKLRNFIYYNSNRTTVQEGLERTAMLSANCTTPEGLCYPALAKYIAHKAGGRKMLFITITDGAPYSPKFEYSCPTARTQVSDAVKGMVKRGIEPLAYFVGSGVDISYYNGYGKLVDVNDIRKIAADINAKMLAIYEKQ